MNAYNTRESRAAEFRRLLLICGIGWALVVAACFFAMLLYRAVENWHTPAHASCAKAVLAWHSHLLVTGHSGGTRDTRSDAPQCRTDPY